MMQCTCFEVKFSKAVNRKQRRHGRMTCRGASGCTGRVRWKCRNPKCGKTKFIFVPHPKSPAFEGTVNGGCDTFSSMSGED